MHRTRRTATAAASLAVAAATLVATAPPGAAGGTTGGDARTEYAFTFAATGGSVATTIHSDASDASPMGFLDYVDPTRTDVAWTTPTSTEKLSVTVSDSSALACETGRTHYYSGITVVGNTADWAKLADGGTTSGRVRVNCTVGSTVHHFHWGEHQLAPGKWLSPVPTPDCVTISRAGDVFTISARGCVVQHEIVSWKPGKQLSTSNVTGDITATVSRGAVFSR